MDCRTARLLLDFARPLTAELAPSEAEPFQEHLADCPDCRTLAQHERRFDEQVGQAMHAVTVPEDLRARLLVQLHHERYAWYRRRLVTPAVLTAAAAAVLLAVWIGFGGRQPLPRPDLDFHALTWQMRAKPEVVEKWFRDTYKVKTAVPPQFDYDNLFSFEMKDFQGKSVPSLLFIRQGFTAQVYILSDKQFDLNNLEDPVGYPVKVLQHPASPHVRYVVIYTSDDLDSFLVKQPFNEARTEALASVRLRDS
jgi:Putative zinc-finger